MKIVVRWLLLAAALLLVAQIYPGVRVADFGTAMIAAFEAGDAAEAERIHEALLPVHAAVFNGPGATNAKSAMYWAGVIPSRAMRLPLLPASDAEYVALTAALEAAGMTR